MLYFWIVFWSMIVILIIGFTFIIWSKTEIYIGYIGDNLQFRIQNTFFRYRYSSKSSKENDSKNTKDNKNKEKNSSIKNKITKFIKESSSSSSDSVNSDNTKKSETNDNADKENVFETFVNSFKGFDKDKKDTLIMVYNIASYIIKHLRYKLIIKKLRLSIDYGGDDAANTGIVCGAFWTGYGVLLPLLNNYFYLTKPSVRFTPWFNTEILEIGFESIIQVKLGHIINAIIFSAIKCFKKHLMK